MSDESIKISESSLQTDREKYLGRVFPVDRDNLQTLNKLFKEIMRDKRGEGNLFVVGGTITKPLPRKDIDIAVVFEPTSNDTIGETQSTPYRRALEDFKIFKDIIKEMIEKSGFKIKRIIITEPSFDEEFESESILKHDGSITVVPEIGTPLEFLRIERRGKVNFIRENKRTSVVI